jgi:hypothetical protein
MAVRNELLGGTDWEDAETLYAADLNDTFDETINAEIPNIFSTISPIGSVFAWLKSLTNTPTLPSNWVECNGQTISDAESVYNGVTIPDLNGSLGSGLKGYFLRGHTSSGLTESSQNLSHSHEVHCGTGTQAGTQTKIYASGIQVTAKDSFSVPSDESGGSEARPNNYSVVWIMRIK